MTNDISVEIRLAFQKALIGNISENVRAICCDWSDDAAWFKVVFYLYIEPNEDERELQSIIMTEFHNDLQDFKKFYEECVFDNRPFEKLDQLRLLIFLRNEISPNYHH